MVHLRRVEDVLAVHDVVEAEALELDREGGPMSTRRRGRAGARWPPEGGRFSGQSFRV